MPIYVYKCETCGQTFEEIQKVDDEAPDYPTDLKRCPEAEALHAHDPSDPQPPAGCALQRQLTTATHRFGADYSNDGVGGYQRQGDVMVRQVQGKTGNDYGSDRSGRS